MNKNYIEYDENTGQIIGNHDLSPEIYGLNKDKQMMEGIADRDLQYIKDGQITDRPNQQTKLIGLTLTGLPVPCTIYINGQSYECNSDTVELEFGQPTLYTIRVEAWPYQDWETTYEN